MTISSPTDTDDAVPLRSGKQDVRIGLAVVAASIVLWWACQFHAAALPFWAPWEFSFTWFYATVLAGGAYGRGLVRSTPRERPAWWRTVSFVLGIAAIYIVLQTRFEYLAEHMFFLNRAQHVVMHHLGPLLIALAWPWPTLLRGMPENARHFFASRWVGHFLQVMRQPFIAAFFFVGLIAFWLVPSIHFRAMLDPRLYLAMNWSMVADGILFWSLVLDPRDKATAGISFGVRAALAIGVMFPQILIGAIIAFSHADLYRFYAWCGRIYPSIGPLDDQNYGGLIIWIPPAMMSVVSLLLVLNALRLSEEQAPSSGTSEGGVSTSSWTGR